jgi:hypothetical protein
VLDRLSEHGETVTVLHQDMYLYVVGSGRVDIYAPDHRLFGTVVLPHVHAENPILVGKHLFYSSNNKLYKFALDIKRNDAEIILPLDNVINDYFITDKDDMYIASDSKIFRYANSVLKTIYEESIPVHRITGARFGCDFKHNLSELTMCHVPTIFYDQMEDNFTSVCRILTEFADSVYTKPEVSEAIECKINKSWRWPFFREIEKNIFIGNDVMDIVDFPRNMFKTFHNYQIILSNMDALLSPSPYAPPITCMVTNHMYKNGLFILPSHLISGLLHIMWPSYAKGWHHNIDSVPRKTCAVVYFVCTDKNHYGASFFYYRHPFSHKIHAVPDIHGTQKFFNLVSDTNNPLWHAIGSFEARRMSFGLSKKADLDVCINKKSQGDEQVRHKLYKF